MQQILSIMEHDPAARRPHRTVPLWHVASYGMDLTRWLRGLPRRDADALLARVLPPFLTLGPACYLAADPSTETSDLGGGAWALVEPGTWRAPASLDVGNFLDSPIHSVGDYVLYSKAAPLPDNAWAGIRFWSGDDVALVRALDAAGVTGAIAVHPDASDWLLALPPLRSGAGTAN